MVSCDRKTAIMVTVGSFLIDKLQKKVVVVEVAAAIAVGCDYGGGGGGGGDDDVAVVAIAAFVTYRFVNYHSCVAYIHHQRKEWTAKCGGALK